MQSYMFQTVYHLFWSTLDEYFKQLSQWLTVSFTTGLRFTAGAGFYLCTKSWPVSEPAPPFRVTVFSDVMPCRWQTGTNVLQELFTKVHGVKSQEP